MYLSVEIATDSRMCLSGLCVALLACCIYVLPSDAAANTTWGHAFALSC